MGTNSKIEWTDATWSPLRVRVKANAAEIAAAAGYASLVQIAAKTAGQTGQHCEHVSDGCLHCYSENWQGRCFKANGTGLPFDRRSRDLVEPFVDERMLDVPLNLRKSKLIFVESQSDLFGQWWEDYQIAQVFAVMCAAHWHTFQVLTKRPERMLALLSSEDFWDEVGMFISAIVDENCDPNERRSDDLRAMAPEVGIGKALPNIWLGVSVEGQATADERMPLLLQCPAAVRFVSYEPALGPVDFDQFPLLTMDSGENPGIDWVIAGGESGPGARPPHPDWFRSVRDQCVNAEVPFFFKQWGEWVTRDHFVLDDEWPINETTVEHAGNRVVMSRAGKKRAGALLDGVEWKQFPRVA